MYFPLQKDGIPSRYISSAFVALALMAGSGSAVAQDDDDQIEEITVTGSQIKGVPMLRCFARIGHLGRGYRSLWHRLG